MSVQGEILTKNKRAVLNKRAEWNFAQNTKRVQRENGQFFIITETLFNLSVQKDPFFLTNAHGGLSVCRCPYRGKPTFRTE